MNCNIHIRDLDFQPKNKSYTRVQLLIRQNQIEVYGPRFRHITSGYLEQIVASSAEFFALKVFRCTSESKQTYVREIWSIETLSVVGCDS